MLRLESSISDWLDVHSTEFGSFPLQNLFFFSSLSVCYLFLFVCCCWLCVVYLCGCTTHTFIFCLFRYSYAYIVYDYYFGYWIISSTKYTFFPFFFSFRYVESIIVFFFFRNRKPGQNNFGFFFPWMNVIGYYFSLHSIQVYQANSTTIISRNSKIEAGKKYIENHIRILWMGAV